MKNILIILNDVFLEQSSPTIDYVCVFEVLSVCTPLALLYMEIVYIIHNDSLLFLGKEPSPIDIG